MTRPAAARVLVPLLHLALLALVAPLAAQPSPRPFYAFESGQVKPLARSPDGRFLFAANTPDNRLEVLRVLPNRLIPIGSVPVGMEPVSVAARTNGEVWVANLLSDNVSVVRLDTNGARVVRTLEVGDEPRSVVFAGENQRFAFVATAHRSLQRDDATGNADVWVFDTDNLGEAAGGTPVAVLNLFMDVPRAMAVSPDGSRVYVAGFKTGNRTAVLSRQQVQGDLPPPLTNVEGVPLPAQGLIVKHDGEAWRDATGRDVSDKVDFEITDNDIYIIDAAGDVPAVSGSIEGVGSVLFNMAVDPQSGDLFVSNLESLNNVRFEGEGVFGGSTVRGHFAESRITVIDPDTGEVSPRHLNKHIDYDSFPGTPAENAASLAMPLDMAITANGRALYVAAFGSSKIGRFSTNGLRNDTFEPRPETHFEVEGGPSGLVLDEARRRLYVYTRFTNSIAVLDAASGNVIFTQALFNPEPESVVEGRPFLYDARFTSSRGDSNCAGCHIFGDKDELGWNLGDPDQLVAPNPNPFHREPGPVQSKDFHPMKGPLATQSLRGMVNAGPMHWRGDRTGGALPGGDPLDSNAAFVAFNIAFTGLLGREDLLTEEQMQSFADFALQLTYPPNPLRNLDNSLTPEQGFGRQVYFSKIVVPETGDRCNDCHRLSPEEGLFGTDGESIIRDQQAIKIPHLRNMYTKMSAPEVAGPAPVQRFRGFGFRHTGELTKMTTLMERFDIGDESSIRSVTEYVLVIETDLAPIVGEQVTLAAGVAADPKLDTMRDRALQMGALPECDLIAKGRLNGEARGWLLLETDEFRSDRAGEAPVSFEALTAIADAPGQELTFTCAPPGAGVRMGIDRDLDGVLDGDEGGGGLGAGGS
jgi:YVTN family beta-propeller protein